jgi:hypothetical protein
MIPVYRVQDDKGRGPWRSGFSKQWVEYRPDHETLLPWPIEFGTEAYEARRNADPGAFMGCACLSIDQLRRWFTASEYITLRGFGYRAVILLADELLHTSDVQSVIVRYAPFAEGTQAVPLYGPQSFKVP